MKDIQLIPPPGPVRFSPDPQQQICIPLGIKNDGHFSPPDILGDQQLCQTGFPDTGGAIDNGVPHTFTQCQRHILLIRLNTMQGRISSHRRQGTDGIQRRVTTNKLPNPGKTVLRFHFKPARCPVQTARLKIVRNLRSQRVLKALGVLLCPAKSPPQKQSLTADRNLPRAHHIAG